ncbi:AAA family ATPase [Candidatus Micrarchaeota archaeon]|nr:AAA family ATPase [Candidatus Micrarchaeota archaeon]
MPSFEDVLKEQKSVFSNKGALSPHFVPDELPYRENEIRKLMVCLAPALSGQKAKNVFLYGKTGTGKSSSTRTVIKKLEDEKNERVKVIYMNCRVYDSRYKVLQKVITAFHPSFAKTGYSFAVLYERLLDWLEKDGKQLVVALDEVDMVKDLDNLVYTLTRANDDLTNGGIAIIGISNKVDFKQRLDARSRSSLCEEEMVFQPYNAEQLKGILSKRSEIAFQDTAVQESAINLAAAVAASENGDARYALLLLLRAGELSDAEKLDNVTDVQVEKSRKSAEEDKAFEIISTLPEHQQLLLYSIATLASEVAYKRLVEEGGEKLYFSGEVYERYAAVAKKLGKEPRTSRWYREYLKELEALGLINTVQSGKGIRGHTTLIRLSYEPQRVKQVIETKVLGE